MEATQAPWARKPATNTTNTNTTTNSTATLAQQSSVTLPITAVIGVDKLIKSAAQIPIWQQSEGYAAIMAFILTLNSAVRGKGMNQRTDRDNNNTIIINPIITILSSFIKDSISLIAEIPPQKQSQRFGNKSFRTWHERIVENIPKLLNQLLSHLTDINSINLPKITAELSNDLRESFGNHTRIDYGTGHELNFIIFLYGLIKLNLLTSVDYQSIIFDIYYPYILLMEELQLTYWLEPAGSKGAWGLDDYQFLIFLFGSSQLIGCNSSISSSPADIHNQSKLSTYSADYLYFHGIKFISKMKTGPFYEHSAMLNSISELNDWNRVNIGLIKMYEAEVLAKFPIIQHIVFGDLLTLKPFKQGISNIGIEIPAATASNNRNNNINTNTDSQSQSQQKKSIPSVPKFEES